MSNELSELLSKCSTTASWTDALSGFEPYIFRCKKATHLSSETSAEESGGSVVSPAEASLDSSS